MSNTRAHQEDGRGSHRHEDQAHEEAQGEEITGLASLPIDDFSDILFVVCKFPFERNEKIKNMIYPWLSFVLADETR